MTRRESTLRDTVLRALAPLDGIAVENPALPGTPDVNVSTGAWIELKSMNAWPKMSHTLIRMDHWTPQQRVWHTRRSRVGGETYVLIEACKSHDFVLLSGLVAVRIIGRATKGELLASAIKVWHGKAEMKIGLLDFLRDPLGLHPGLPATPHVDLLDPQLDRDQRDTDLLAGP